MAKVYLVNFATPNFYKSQKELNANALKFGVDKTISYTFDMIKKTDFYKENKELLDRKRWIGWGSWKPYVILEALKKIEKGDILIYCDSGISFRSSLKDIIKRCNKKGIVLFQSRPVMRQWTKRDTFVLMGCDKKEYHDAHQIMAGLNLWKKTPTSQKIVSQWLEFCKDTRIITDDDNVCGKPNFPDFIEHRGDQSILSILAVKYKKNMDIIDDDDPKYSEYSKKYRCRISTLWDVHRRRDRKPLEWILWKIKMITPVSLKDRIKWFINHYIKK